MRARANLLFLAVSMMPAVGLAVDDFSGDWEIQAMGADTKVSLQQQNGQLIVHREMWPEFEKERYKLEHMYRGKIDGTDISGQLLVREDGKGKFEVLRPFRGRVISSSTLDIDSHQLKRIGATDASRPAAARPGASTPRPPASPQRPAKPPPSEPSSGAGQSLSLFDSIMESTSIRNLFEMEAREIPPAAKRLTKEGDRLFAARKYSAAIAKYRAAYNTEGSRGIDLLHRMGRCYAKLRMWADARTVLRRALRLDPSNGAVRDAYMRAKRGR